MSWGRVTIGAGAGDPWRVRYDLRFPILTSLTAILCVGLVVIGYGWPRGALIILLGLFWLLVYGIPSWRAMRMFRGLVSAAEREEPGGGIS
jgi:hypothetical protein